MEQKDSAEKKKVPFNKFNFSCEELWEFFQAIF